MKVVLEGKKAVKNWGMLTAYRYANTPNQNKKLLSTLWSQTKKSPSPWSR